MFVRKDGQKYAAETGAITIGPNPSFIKILLTPEVLMLMAV